MVTPRIDLHAHSSVSDGTEPPATLVTDAAAAGLTTVAITDHDTLDGWDEAFSVAEKAGIDVVPGMEMSCELDGVSVHLLVYWPDPRSTELLDELARIRQGRDGRLPTMLRQLDEVGVHLTEEQIADSAGTAVSLGRPHIADAMIKAGYVADRQEAFDRYLVEGRPGYVARYSTELPDAITLARRVGGVPVIAHPWGRLSRPVLTPEVLARCASDLGLAGVEARHQDHPAEAISELTGLAGELGLLVTGGSDWHGSGKVDHDLGVHTTDPEVLERLAAQARTSGD